MPHGLANAILLPFVTEFNELSDKGKYYDIYRWISLAPVAKKDFVPNMLTQEIKVLNRSLDIPGTLSEVGVKEEIFGSMTDDAMKSGNIAVNPRQTTRQDILDLYNKAFQ